MIWLVIYTLLGLLLAEALIIAARNNEQPFRVTAGHYVLCLLLWPLILVGSFLKIIRG